GSDRRVCASPPASLPRGVEKGKTRPPAGEGKRPNKFTLDWLGGPPPLPTANLLQSTGPRPLPPRPAESAHLVGTDPLRNGTPLAEGLYSLEVHPLRISYEIDSSSRVVTVVSVGQLP